MMPEHIKNFKKFSRERGYRTVGINPTDKKFMSIYQIEHKATTNMTNVELAILAFKNRMSISDFADCIGVSYNRSRELLRKITKEYKKYYAI